VNARKIHNKCLKEHTGCEAGLPRAIGPPPPLRTGAMACDAITLRDKPAMVAGRSAMAAQRQLQNAARVSAHVCGDVSRTVYDAVEFGPANPGLFSMPCPIPPDTLLPQPGAVISHRFSFWQLPHQRVQCT